MLHLLITPAAKPLCRSGLWGLKSPVEEVDLLIDCAERSLNMFVLFSNPLGFELKSPEEEVNLLIDWAERSLNTFLLFSHPLGLTFV